MLGPNLKGVSDLLDSVSIPVISSGGISKLDDLRDLLKFENRGLYGAITGKAIYEDRLDLREAIALCSPKG